MVNKLKFKKLKYFNKNLNNFLLIKKNRTIECKDLWYTDKLISIFLRQFLKSGKSYNLQKEYYNLILISKSLKLNFFFLFKYVSFFLRFSWFLKKTTRIIKKRKQQQFLKPLLLTYIRQYKIRFFLLRKHLSKSLNGVFSEKLLLEFLFCSFNPNNSFLVKDQVANNLLVYQYYKKRYRNKQNKHFRW